MPLKYGRIVCRKTIGFRVKCSLDTILTIDMLKFMVMCCSKSCFANRNYTTCLKESLESNFFLKSWNYVLGLWYSAFQSLVILGSIWVQSLGINWTKIECCTYLLYLTFSLMGNGKIISWFIRPESHDLNIQVQIKRSDCKSIWAHKFIQLPNWVQWWTEYPLMLFRHFFDGQVTGKYWFRYGLYLFLSTTQLG